MKGHVMWLAHPLDSMYHLHGARIHRDYFFNALRLMYSQPVFMTSLPSAGRANFLNQPQHNSYVAHLLYAPSHKRGSCEVIEDMPPLFNVPVDISVPETITRVRLMPQGEPVDFDVVDDRLRLSVPEFLCHQMVVFDYE